MSTQKKQPKTADSQLERFMSALLRKTRWADSIGREGGKVGYITRDEIWKIFETIVNEEAA